MRPHSRVSRAVVMVFLAVALMVTSSPAPVHAASAATGPGGSYAGAETPTEPNPLDRLEIGFDVTKNGRKVKHWLVTMNVICGLDVKLISQSMPTMKVKRSGRFHGLFEGVQDGTAYRVEVGGKLVAKKRKVTQGTLAYKVGSCQRGNVAGDPLDWTAKRTGR